MNISFMHLKGQGRKMTRKQWKTKIKKACNAAGTYHPSFETAIDTLAGILETRDKAEKDYIDNGSEPVIHHTNKNGAVNVVKNPALAVVEACNADALAYLRDLGLTAKGLKSIGLNIDTKEKQGLGDVLADLGI